MGVQTRYGVFLRPDPRTCAAVTTITTHLRAQYGLRSAGAFPPHATLAGSLPLAVPPNGLVAALDQVLSGRPVFPVQNAGVRRLGEAVLVYDLHELDGVANAPLIDLASAVDGAVRPLLAPAPAGQLAADTYQEGRWHGHLSLASHELFERADLREEVQDYVAGLDVVHPAGLRADVVALCRLTHSSWSGSWWEAMRWEHVHSWRLLGSGPSTR